MWLINFRGVKNGYYQDFVCLIVLNCNQDNFFFFEFSDGKALIYP